MGELASKIRAKYPGSYDALPDAELEAKVIAKYPGVYDDLVSKTTVQGKPDASPAETERTRRQFIAAEGTLPTRAKEFIRSSFDPTQATPAADSVKDFATRVLPESATKLIPRIGMAAYEAVKGQTDPMVRSLSTLQPTGLPGREMERSAGGTLTNLAKAVTAPTGLMGLGAAKEAWTTDPVGSALAVAPTIKVLKNAKSSLAKPPEVALDATINKQYQQAVRPSVSGTAGNYKQFTDANKKAVEGVYDIVRAKDRGELKLGDEMAGQIPANRLPESMQEHLQAISQSKLNTFSKYDSMKQAAGDAGATVDLSPVASELYKASGDAVLNDLRPDTAKYMKKQADILSERKQYTAGQAQSAISTLNKDLESFYKNPSPDMAGKMVVDASIAKHLRKALDDAIEKEAGPGYQELKNEYGRLTAMEKDAGHRARVAGRAAPASLIDAIGGYLGSGEIVSGVLSMNPALVAKGGIMLVLKGYIKRLNSPDYKIKQMYKLADKKYTRPQETSFTPPERKEAEAPVYPGAGKINTLNLPVGDRGAAANTRPRIPMNLPVGSQGYSVPRVPLNLPVGTTPAAPSRIPLNLPVGEQMMLDPTIGRMIPVRQNTAPRSLADLQTGAETFYDPTIGARTLRKQ